MTHEYKYPLDRIEVEKSVQFGTEVREKSVDIVLYKEDKITPYVIFELKQPNAKKAEEQLKSYLSAEGAEGGVWSNGIQRFILYRPYPKEYITALSDIPNVNQTWDDLFEEKRAYDELQEQFDLSFIISRLEEMVLAQAGVNVFEEVFKIIYAKLYDEDQARIFRAKKEVHFRQYKEPKKTYVVINDELFKGAIKEWEDIFNPLSKIDLTPEQLQICVPFLGGVKFLGSGREELEIIDRAFEHLIAEVSKGQKGQYFTPRNVIKMCVKMLSPQKDERIIDPACGSGGFLLHTMYWVWDNDLKSASPTAKQKYANRYLYGIDFDDNMRRISQALMLIAGDGRHNIFKRNSLDGRDWIGQKSSFGPFLPELKGVITRLVNNGLIREEQLGRMFAVKVGPTFRDARKAYMSDLVKWESIIDKTSDLFMRMQTRQSEVVATVLFAANVVANRKKEQPSEKEVLTEVMEWKQRRRPKLDDKEVAYTIRNLAALSWLKVKPSSDLQIPDEIIAEA